MKTTWLSLCSWCFEYQDDSYQQDEFQSFSKIVRDEMIDKKLDYLHSVLYLFHKYNLLEVDKIEGAFIKNNPLEYNETVELESLISDLSMSFKDNYALNHPPLYANLTGITTIRTSEGSQKIDGVIKLQYSLLGNRIDISIHSDLWSPMDMEENYQIDLALLNSPRLEACLKDIKGLCDYSYICPDEGEMDGDGLSQLGFRILVPHPDVLERDDFPKGREEDMKKFMWQYLPPYLT